MTTLMTITAKGQVTFPKALLGAMGVGVGDRLIARVEKKRVIVEPVGRGLLDLKGSMGRIKIPKGKTVDDLIHEATLYYAARDVR